MYQPPHFRETDITALFGHIRANPLGLLISTRAAGAIADPVPFVLADEGDKGILRAHLARANPQLAALRDNPAALVVFQGVDRYVTPSWYPQKAIDRKVVPTWNYAIVEARGTARLIEDTDWLMAQIGALTDAHEAKRERPWSVADAPSAYIASQLRGIVGVEIVIEAIEGKFKASQNRPVADRAGVAAGLAADGDDRSLMMRALVKARGGV